MSMQTTTETMRRAGGLSRKSVAERVAQKIAAAYQEMEDAHTELQEAADRLACAREDYNEALAEARTFGEEIAEELRAEAEEVLADPGGLEGEDLPDDEMVARAEQKAGELEDLASDMEDLGIEEVDLDVELPELPENDAPAILRAAVARLGC